MSVVISDALARDLLWWLQNTSVPYVTVGERWRSQCNRKEPSMEIARDSMVEELSGAMAHPDAMQDDFDATLDKQLSDMARACGQVYHQVNHKVKKVELTVEEANLLFKVIDVFFDLRLPTTKEIVALNKLKVRVKRIEQAEINHAKGDI